MDSKASTQNKNAKLIFIDYRGATFSVRFSGV